MKAGDNINGYRILRDFTTAGGGLSKWTFAERGGKQYFFKEFLAPTYPTDESPGSPKTKQQKRERCKLFEHHHKALKDAIAAKCSEGGNLVYTLNFFRSGTKYYKVTEKIDVSGLTVKKISALPLEKKVLILKTVAHSLDILHGLGIVHGDLKPDNILIKQTAEDYYTAKLIDFDNSYFSGKPPAISEEVVGDMVYYSPELALYIQKSDTVKATSLQTKSDVFALGLIYCQYLTGDLPVFKRKYQYACEAVLNGEKLASSVSGVPPSLANLLAEMMSAEPEKRPHVKEVFSRLKSVKADEVAAKPIVASGGKLGGSLLKKSKDAAAAAPKPDAVKVEPAAKIESEPKTTSRLGGTLIKKLR